MFRYRSPFFFHWNLYLSELEFTFDFNFYSVTFLDLNVSRTREGFLSADLFVKPTFKNLYLQYDSYHSKSTLDNVAYRQALRIKVICTDERDLNSNLDNLQQNLVKRGYPASKVRSKISKAKNVPRDKLLHPRTEMKKQRQIVAAFVTTRNPRLPP